MPTTRPQRDLDLPDDEPAAEDLPRAPDEDGPHDVPDDKVIERTLPSAPLRDKG